MLKGFFTFSFFLGAPLLCISEVTPQGPSQTNYEELCPGKTEHWTFWVQLMCRKIPAESIRGLTGAVPHLQIHWKVELNDETYQLGRTTLSLLNLPIRITQPEQGKETAYHADTTLQDYFFLEFYATNGISDVKQIVGRNLRWFGANVWMLSEALAIQPQALLFLIRFDWHSDTSVCTSAPWYQAWRFQILYLTPFPGCIPCCGMASET